MVASSSLLALVACVFVGALAVPVTEFPPLSLYTGNGGYSASSTDNLGTAAINGDVVLKNYGVGDPANPAPSGSLDSLVVQGSASFSSVSVFNGNLVVCGTITGSATVTDGTTIQSCNRFDFADTNTFVSDFSQTFAQLPPTGAPTRVDNEFTFNANPSVAVNVYLVPAKLFDAIQFLTINAPAGVFVVINIDGATNTFQNFQTNLVGGIDERHIIYNFFATSALTVQNIGVEGTIVAPQATVQFNNGHIDGSFFVATLSGNGEIHPFPPITPPCPNPPCPPCPTIAPLAPFTAFAIADINSQNSDDIGYMAAGGNINLASYSIGGNATFDVCPIALLSGGSITYTNGGVNGNIVAGTTATLTHVTLPPTCSVTRGAGRNAVINFDQVAASLKAVSLAYGSRPATNPTVRMYNEVTLETGATADGISVFSFPSSLLAGCTGLTVIAPVGQLVLINVPGANNTIQNFNIALQGGVDAAHVLWNYYESAYLGIDDVYVQGTTLAPLADVNFNSGQLHGALYADNIEGYGEYHPQPPVIPICPICPVNPCKQ